MNADTGLAGRIYLKRFGAALCLQPEAREVYTVRTKDLPRIIGVDDSRIKHIYESSRASVGVMVTLTAMRYYTAQIEVSGTRDEVRVAVEMIEEAIREIYPENSVRLALTTEYLQYDSLDFDFPKAAYLLNHINLIDIESETLTWIEVDVSRPATAEGERQLHILFCGTRRNIQHAARLIKEREAQVREPEGPGAVDRMFKYLSIQVKAAYAKVKCCGQDAPVVVG